MSKIEDLKAKKALIEKRISQLQIQHSVAERKAETHVKAALGGAVIALLGTLASTIHYAILNGADAGIQKDGLGREKFEALKARFAKPTTGERI